MNFSDLLNVELYNDNLKMFNLVVIWMNMSWRTCMSDEWNSPHSWSMRWPETGAEQLLLKLRTTVNDILEQQQHKMLISHKGRSRDRAAAYSSKGADEKGKDCRSFCSCSKGGQCSFEQDTAKKGKGKGNRSRNLVRRVKSDDSMPVRQVPLDKKIVLHVQTKNKVIAVMVESVNIGIFRIAGTSRKMNVKLVRIVHTHSQKKNRSTSPKGKGKGKESEQEKVTVAFENVANHRPRSTSDKLLQFDTSMNCPSKAKWNHEQMEWSKMPMKGILAL